ncbi:MAG: hypothetical protein LBC35_07705 [Coriobacteriales bacterium]|jgi:type II secretory pathway pseudopilin PulG|nr:hypothetical protein [Coriobacteriales bacterium]
MNRATHYCWGDKRVISSSCSGDFGNLSESETCCDSSGSYKVRSFGGFTLVELIVGMMVAVLIIAVTMSIVFASMNSAKAVTSINERDALLEMTLSSIIRQAAFSRDVGTADVPTDVLAKNCYFYIGDAAEVPAQKGSLYVRKGGQATQSVLYTPLQHNGWQMALEAHVAQTPSSGLALTVTLTLYSRDGGEVISKSRSIALSNYSSSGSPDVPSSPQTIASPQVLVLYQ